MFEKSRKVVVFFLLHFLFSSDSFTEARRLKDTENTKSPVKDFVGLVAEHGRQAERHTVTTEDGYILPIFRILPNHSANSSHYGPPVYLQHPLGTCADVFVLMEGDRNIAFLLADAGYDVWVGNLRGNSYSRKHRTLSRLDSKFWDFSIDEYALKDAPASVDYILDVTNRSSLSYIGMSLGTTISTILLSKRTDSNNKLNLVVQLAPVSFFKTLTAGRKMIISILALLDGPNRAVEMFPRDKFMYSFVKFVCLTSDIMEEMCLSLYDIVAGKDREQSKNMPRDLVLKALNYLPSGLSAKVLYHFAQFAKTGEFAYYDHGDNRTNIRYYGQAMPPAYNLTNIVAPMVFLKALNDPLSTLLDDLTLISRLPSNRKIYYEIVKWKNFNHFDFIIAEDVKTLVYDRLLEILSQFNKFP